MSLRIQIRTNPSAPIKPSEWFATKTPTLSFVRLNFSNYPLSRLIILTIFTLLLFLPNSLNAQTQDTTWSRIVDPIIARENTLNDSNINPGIDSTLVTEIQGQDTLKVMTDENGYFPIPQPLIVKDTITIPVKKGWNMVANPLYENNETPQGLFTNASSNAFMYNGSSYTITNDLLNNQGFWIKFNEDEEVKISGKKIAGKDSVNVNEGWNLIGAREKKIPRKNITSNPSNAIISNFFGYDGGYVKADTLNPGEGYWVKTNSASTIYFNDTSSTNSLEARINQDLVPPSEPFSEKASGKTKSKTKVLTSQDVNGRINFNINNVNEGEFSIYNLLGQEIFKTSLDNGNYNVSWNIEKNNEKLSSGMYLYELRDNTGITTGKFMNINGKLFSEAKSLEGPFSEKASGKTSINKLGIDKNVSYYNPIRIIAKDMNQNYYVTDITEPSRDSIPDKIPMFPGQKLLNFNHPDYPYTTSPLSWLEWVTYSDSTYPSTLGKWLEYPGLDKQPIKVFANRSQMPDTNYAVAFDLGIQEWMDVTSFPYQKAGKGDSVTLTREPLFTEVASNPDTGIKLMYDGNISYGGADSYYSQTFSFTPPVSGPWKHWTAHINNTLSNQCNATCIMPALLHELHWPLFQVGDNNREDSHDDDYYPKDYFGTSKKVTNSLQGFYVPGYIMDGQINLTMFQEHQNPGSDTSLKNSSKTSNTYNSSAKVNYNYVPTKKK